jgi:hypothetical protein
MPADRALDLGLVSHPSLGLPPHDLTAGHPAAAARLRAARADIGRRALEIALDRDPGLRERHDEHALRALLRDTDILVERIALAVAADDVTFVREFADQVAPLYRRRRVPMDDVVALLEGLRSAMTTVLAPAEQESADRAIDAGVKVLRDYRRIGGDARRRNPLLAMLYRGG